MRHNSLRLAAFALIGVAAPALAHTGHLEEAAGHTHWLALGALSVAALVALAGLARSVRRRKIDTAGKSAARK